MAAPPVSPDLAELRAFCVAADLGTFGRCRRPPARLPARPHQADAEPRGEGGRHAARALAPGRHAHAGGRRLIRARAGAAAGRRPGGRGDGGHPGRGGARAPRVQPLGRRGVRRRHARRGRPGAGGARDRETRRWCAACGDGRADLGSPPRAPATRPTPACASSRSPRTRGLRRPARPSLARRHTPVPLSASWPSRWWCATRPPTPAGRWTRCSRSAAERRVAAWSRRPRRARRSPRPAPGARRCS